MKKQSIRGLFMSLIVLTGLMLPVSLRAQDEKKDKDIENCMETKAAFIKTDGLMKNLFEKSAGYVIFPNIGKGGLGVGGATGNGIVFENGKAIGKVNMTQLTVGAQAGGKLYSEVIFFETKEPLERLKNDKFEFTAQASAVAIKAGISMNAKYRDGVLVFTQEKGGLMYEASLGGQKFTYNSY